MKNKKQFYKTIRTLAVIVLMLLQGGGVPIGDGNKGDEYRHSTPDGGLICQPEVIYKQR
jgi:hypothetical protein